MNDDKCGCGSKISSKNSGPEECGCEVEDSSTIEKDAGCGCGCGDTEYPDLSTLENPDPPKFITDESFLKEFEEHAHSLGIKSIGYSQITRELLNKDKFIQYPHVIVLTMEMDEDIIKTVPGKEAQELNEAAYNQLGKLSYTLSDYLRKNGFATEVAHPYENDVKFSLLAQKAGLGHVGKSGLLITPELGPRQKISAIFVSMVNLPEKENTHTWIPDYCKRCHQCLKACRKKALVEKESCCGDKQVQLIKNLCIGCSQGCTYCIEECPFDQKGYAHIKIKFDKLMEKTKQCC